MAALFFLSCIVLFIYICGRYMYNVQYIEHSYVCFVRLFMHFHPVNCEKGKETKRPIAAIGESNREISNNKICI